MSFFFAHLIWHKKNSYEPKELWNHFFLNKCYFKKFKISGKATEWQSRLQISSPFLHPTFSLEPKSSSRANHNCDELTCISTGHHPLALTCTKQLTPSFSHYAFSLDLEFAMDRRVSVSVLLSIPQQTQQPTSSYAKGGMKSPYVLSPQRWTLLLLHPFAAAQAVKNASLSCCTTTVTCHNVYFNVVNCPWWWPTAWELGCIHFSHNNFDALSSLTPQLLHKNWGFTVRTVLSSSSYTNGDTKKALSIFISGSLKEKRKEEEVWWSGLPKGILFVLVKMQ